jgi:hypothetical protein
MQRVEEAPGPVGEMGQELKSRTQQEKDDDQRERAEDDPLQDRAE